MKEILINVWGQVSAAFLKYAFGGFTMALVGTGLFYYQLWNIDYAELTEQNGKEQTEETSEPTTDTSVTGERGVENELADEQSEQIERASGRTDAIRKEPAPTLVAVVGDVEQLEIKVNLQ